jgi:LuxR family maltose regulon positive regulatory protein
MLSQATPSKAAVRLAQSITEAEQRGWLGAAIELHILRSLALDQHNRPREAQADLERALALAEPEGYARIFLDEGQPMHGLLSQWQAHASAGPLRDYANRLLSQLDGELPAIAAEQETPSPAQNLIEPLTRRELEILCLMGAGLSNRQIAEKLFLSEGTIKFHVHSILAKLEVHSRTAALARAKELRLVP